MNISEFTQPKSDQLDGIDLIDGPRTFTIERLSKGSSEQPVNIHLEEFPRPWRPSKNMLRVLQQVWGPDGTQYVGRRITLYYDPEVTFGKEKPGGTRIKAMSHIDKPATARIMLTRGQPGKWVVEPLVEKTQPSLAERIEKAVAAFEGAGITVEQLETRISSERSKWSNEDVAHLGGLFQQLQRGELTAADFAPAPEADEITGEVIDGEVQA